VRCGLQAKQRHPDDMEWIVMLATAASWLRRRTVVVCCAAGFLEDDW